MPIPVQAFPDGGALRCRLRNPVPLQPPVHPGKLPQPTRLVSFGPSPPLPTIRPVSGRCVLQGFLPVHREDLHGCRSRCVGSAERVHTKTAESAPQDARRVSVGGADRHHRQPAAGPGHDRPGLCTGLLLLPALPAKPIGCATPGLQHPVRGVSRGGARSNNGALKKIFSAHAGIVPSGPTAEDLGLGRPPAQERGTGAPFFETARQALPRQGAWK